MASQMSLPQNLKIVNGTPVATTNGGVTCDYISCKNAHKVCILCELLQAVSHTTALGLTESTDVAGTTTATVTATCPIWKNADVSSTDTLVRGTDAASVSATAGATNQQLILEWEPAQHTSGYDCIAATLSNSSQATNFATVTYFIQERYQQATPPAAITD